MLMKLGYAFLDVVTVVPLRVYAVLFAIVNAIVIELSARIALVLLMFCHLCWIFCILSHSSPCASRVVYTSLLIEFECMVWLSPFPWDGLLPAS